MGWCSSCCFTLLALLALALAILIPRLPELVAPLEKLHQSCEPNPVPEAGRALAAPAVEYKCGVAKVPSASPNVRVEAYLQPSGGLCWSNAGVLSVPGQTLIIDSVQSTRLQANFNKQSELLADARGGGSSSCKDCLFALTHPDVDHFLGISAMLANRSIMHGLAGPKVDEQFTRVARMKLMLSIGTLAGVLVERVLTFLERDPPMALASFLAKTDISRQMFRFGVESLATEWPAGLHRRTFNQREKEVAPGVHMICPGGIHSYMDCWVLSEEAKVVFSGDLLFVGVTPIMWRGTMQEWVDALDEMLERTQSSGDWHYVAGHGPVVGKAGVRSVRDYWTWAARAVTSLCPEASEADAEKCTRSLLKELPSPYTSWIHKERIMASVYVELYTRSHGGAKPSLDVTEKINLLTRIQALEKESR